MRALLINRSSRLGTHRRKEGLKIFEMDELERLVRNAGFAKVEVSVGRKRRVEGGRFLRLNYFSQGRRFS